MRRTALAAALALSLMPAARATPSAGYVRADTATAYYVGSDRRLWQVAVTVTYAVAGTQLDRDVTFRLTQCDARGRCTYSTLWQATLPLTEPHEAQPDGSEVTLTTTFAGRPMTVAWTRENQVVNDWIAIAGNNVVERVDYTATAVVTYAGVTCRKVPGSGYDVRGFWSSGGPFSDAPAAPREIPRAVRGTVRCAR